LEAMVERALRYLGAARDRFDRRRTIAQGEKLLGRGVNDAMRELLGVRLRRPAAATRHHDAGVSRLEGAGGGRLPGQDIRAACMRLAWVVVRLRRRGGVVSRGGRIVGRTR